MSFLPKWLKQLLQKNKEGEDQAYSIVFVGVELTDLQSQQAQVLDTTDFEMPDASGKIGRQDFEIYPEDPAVRKQWFSLTIRERQVVALVCMGHRNYEIASILGIGHATIQTHLQKVYRKFGLRGRNEIRNALVTWAAEEWWNYHHY